MATLSKVALPVPAWIVASPVNGGEGEQARMGGQSHPCPAAPPYCGIVLRGTAPFASRTSACAMMRWFGMQLTQQE